MKKILSQLKDSSYLKNSTTKFGASLATFALGALLVMNIGGVGAEAPTQNPPRGEINATFDSVTVDTFVAAEGGLTSGGQLMVSGDSFMLGNAQVSGQLQTNGLRTLDLNVNGDIASSNGDVVIDDSLTVTGELRLNDSITNNLGNININDNLNISGNLQLSDGNLTLSSGNKIGSYYSVTNRKYFNDNNLKYLEIDASCLPDDIVVSCSGSVDQAASGLSSPFHYANLLSSWKPLKDETPVCKRFGCSYPNNTTRCSASAVGQARDLDVNNDDSQPYFESTAFCFSPSSLVRRNTLSESYDTQL
jgi:hypothetical protein